MGVDYAHHIATDPPRFLDLSTALLFQERERMEKRRLELRSGKGQLFSKANFFVLIWTKKRTKLFFEFCPNDLK